MDVIVRVLKGDSLDAKPFGVRGHANLYFISYELTNGQDPTHANARRLYEAYSHVLTEFLDREVLSRASAAHTLTMLSEVRLWWGRYRTLVSWLYRLLKHLDHNYVESAKLPTLTTVALRLFHTKIYTRRMGERVTAVSIATLNRERDGLVIDGDTLRLAIELFETMGTAASRSDVASLSRLAVRARDLDVYRASFEAPFLQASERYWLQAGARWRASCDVPAYLARAEAAIAGERARVRRYLHRSTEAMAVEIVCRAVLESCGPALLSDAASGPPAMLRTGDDAGLRRALRLFQGIPACHEALAGAFGAWVRELGEGVLSRRRDGAFVAQLLSLRAAAARKAGAVFGGDAAFEGALKAALGAVVNAGPAPLDEGGEASTNALLAAHLDGVLKGALRLPDSELDAHLEGCMRLFAYLDDKDFFMEAFRKRLARRLLSGRSVGEESERLVISAMKLDMGTAFTTKVEGMVNDLRLGEAVKAAYERHCQAGKEAEREAEEKEREAEEKDTDAEQKDTDAEQKEQIAEEGIAERRGAPKAPPAPNPAPPPQPPPAAHVRVLTSGFWPREEDPPLAPPACVAAALEHFKQWYTGAHSHRALSWAHALGEAEVSASYGAAATYQVGMSCYQAALLLEAAAAGPAGVRVGALAEAVGVSLGVAKRALHGMSCLAKCRLLRKSGAEKAVREGDVVAANERFRSAKRRFRVPQPSLRATKATQRAVVEDRSFMVDAAIVRVMKARKELSHALLVQEVLRQMTLFKPDPRNVKQRIEVLLEKEYLERDADDRRTYRYVP